MVNHMRPALSELERGCIFQWNSLLLISLSEELSLGNTKRRCALYIRKIETELGCPLSDLVDQQYAPEHWSKDLLQTLSYFVVNGGCPRAEVTRLLINQIVERALAR